MSIKYKLLILTLVPVFCVTLLGGALSIWITVSEHEDLARREMVGHLGQLENHLNRFSSDVSKVLESMVSDGTFSAMVRSLQSLGGDASALRMNTVCQVMQFLQHWLDPAACDASALYGPDGIYGFALRDQYGIQSIDRDTGRTALFVPTADSALADCASKRWKESVLPTSIPDTLRMPEMPSTAFKTAGRSLVMEGVAPIKTLTFSMSTFKEEEVTVGTLLIQTALRPEVLKSYASQASTDYYVFSPEGDLMLSSSPFAMEGGMEFMARARDADVLVERTFGGEPCTLLLRPYRQGGATVAILATRVSRSVVERQIARIVWLQLGGLAIGLVVAVVVAFGTARTIATPLWRISREMKEIARTQDLDRRVTVRSKDEIGELSHSFNEMTRHLKEASEAVEAYREHLEDLVARRTAELRENVVKLEEANQRVVESIQYARTIQKAILPTEQAIASQVPDHFVIWHPKDVIGGDIFWFNGEDRGFLFAVIDCTGHGVPGAVMTMISSTTLNRVVHETGIDDPARVLERLNRLVQGTLSRDSSEPLSDDGLDIGICCVDAARTTLTFAGARISLFYTRADEVCEIKGDRHSIGYASSDPEYIFTNHTVSVDADMCFYMATDGMHDQVGGEKHLPFGKGRFKRLLAENHRKPFSEQRDVLIHAFREYKGSDIQRDDVTVVGFTV